jgi:hypothetical protein
MRRETHPQRAALPRGQGARKTCSQERATESARKRRTALRAASVEQTSTVIGCPRLRRRRSVTRARRAARSRSWRVRRQLPITVDRREAHADHCVHRGTRSFRGSGPLWGRPGVAAPSGDVCDGRRTSKRINGRRCTHAACTSYRQFEKFAELARTALVFRCRLSGSGLEPMVLEGWSHDRRRAHGLSQLPGRSRVSRTRVGASRARRHLGWNERGRARTPAPEPGPDQRLPRQVGRIKAYSLALFSDARRRSAGGRP